MPAYHHGVEVEVLKSKGLKLSYYRINEKMEIDIDHLDSLVSPRTRLLYVIHYFGFSHPIRHLHDITKKHGLFLFEDCALSLFSRFPDGEPMGSVGDVSIFCLYKTLSVPQGGVMVLNSPDLSLPPVANTPNLASTVGYLINLLLDYFELKWDGTGHAINTALRNLGREIKRKSKIKNIPIDTNSFNEEFVSLGISRITHYLINRMNADIIVRRRRNNFLYLLNLLKDKIFMPFKGLINGTCPLSLPIFVRDKEAVYSRLLSEGIGTITFWSTGNPDIPEGTFPEVDFLRKHVLEIPVHQELEERHLDYIASKVKKHARW